MRPPLLLLPLLWAGSLAKDDRFRLDVPELVTVQEGLCVTVPCSFSSSWRISSYESSASGYWFRDGDDTIRGSAVATNDPNRPVQKDTQGRFHLLGNPEICNCSLSIRDARKSDSGSYVFRVERGYTRWTSTNKFFLHVAALTLTPDIHIPGTLESGRPSNLTCSVPWACEQGTAPLFSWTSAVLTSSGPSTTHSSVLTLTPWPLTQGLNLTCRVTFPGAGVTTERTVLLSVSWDQGTSRGTGVALGAVGGAGVTALLAVGLCLIFFIVKTHRKKAAGRAVGVSDSHPADGPACLGHQQEYKLHGLSEPPSSSEASLTLDMEQELHYASLSFHGMMPQGGTSTEYSEIRTQ